MDKLNRVCIIGVGLIGGSLARALKRANFCSEIVGAGRHAAHLREAVDLGVIDRAETDFAVAVQGADLIVVAVPLGAMEAVFSQIAPHMSGTAVLTDVGSAKAGVVHAARAAFGSVPPWFVPGHPIAGTEQSGVSASFAELFEGRRVILTPLRDTDARAVGLVRAMWERTGALVSEMDILHHDEVLAATSHLPHVLAYTLVESLARLGDRDEIFQYAAGGFRDFTRIASSDPTMWRDICLGNREALLAVLARFSGDLAQVTEAVNNADGERLLALFTRAKQARDRVIS